MKIKTNTNLTTSFKIKAHIPEDAEDNPELDADEKEIQYEQEVEEILA